MQPSQDPFRPQGTMPEQGQQPQWTQVPFPGQLNYGQAGQQGYAQPIQPGQVPPPAQLQPEVTYGQLPPQMQLLQQPEPQPQQSVQAQPAGQQAVYQPPKTGMPGVKKMNNRTAYIVLVVLVLVFAAFAIVRLTAPGQVDFALVQAGSMSSRFTGDAVIVRNEIVETHEGVSQIDYIAKEGELLERSKPVATVYDSGFSARELKKLNDYRSQIKEKQKSLMGNVANDSHMLNLLSQVTERGMEVQSMVQSNSGDLVKQEELLQQVIEDRQIYMRQKFKEDPKLNLLWEEEAYQLNRISNWTKQYYSNSQGLVSFYSDGFETALNTNTYNQYSPTEVRKIYQGQIPQNGAQINRKAVPIYRMVKQEPWVVLMLCNEQEWMPVEGRTYKMLIESFDNIIVDATVESFTRSGGELLVRLLVYDTSKLPSVMYMRSCKVQLGENVNSLSVPSRAIYQQNGRKGVVMSTQGGEYWTGVEVISDDGQTAYIIPENPGLLYEGVRVRLF